MTFPTTSVPKAAVALVIVVVPAVTPSATVYWAASWSVQSVPVAPDLKPPPLVSLPPRRMFQAIAALRAISAVPRAGELHHQRADERGVISTDPALPRTGVAHVDGVSDHVDE